jgi:hypothetical protein
MALSREERLALQDDDPGDPDTGVYVQTSAEDARQKASRYHSTTNCSRVRVSADPDGYEQRPRREAWQRWLAPCSACVLDSPSADDAAPVDHGHRDSATTCDGRGIATGFDARQFNADPDADPEVDV